MTTRRQGAPQARSSSHRTAAAPPPSTRPKLEETHDDNRKNPNTTPSVACSTALGAEVASVSRAGGARADVGPPMWEIPAAVALTWVTVAALILPGARGVAGMLFGAGWAWPHQSQGLVAAVGGLLSGDARAGLTTSEAAGLPPAAVVYTLIVVGQLLLIVATICAVLWWRRTFGSGSHSGMADRGAAEAVLGVSRLRAVRAVIRPDLYPPLQVPAAEPPGDGAP